MSTTNMNSNPYDWTLETVRQNSAVAERDHEIMLLKQRLTRYEALPCKTIVETMEHAFLRWVLPFVMGMLFGMALLVMRITE